MASSADTTPTTSTNTIPMIAKHPTAFIRWILPSRDTNDDGVRYNVTPYKKEFMPQLFTPVGTSGTNDFSGRLWI